MYDVAVIGGGPAGCYTAHGLAREGFDVVVLEKNGTCRQPPVCTGVVGVEAFEKFSLPSDSILTQVEDIEFISPSGKLLPYRPGHVQAHVVDRIKFNEGLRKLALESGSSLLQETACLDIRITPEHVELKTSTSEGPLRARSAVLACGYNPKLTRKLHLGDIAYVYEGAQTEIRMDGLSATEIYVGRNVAPSSFAWAVNVKDGRARVGLITKKGASKFLEAFLDSNFLKGRIKETGTISHRTIPLGGLERTYSDRLLAVGEVAGQVKTTTHGGIYYGLIAAQAAAETLSRALRLNDLGASRLKDYERRWRALLDPELSKGRLFRRFFERLSDTHIDGLFSLALKDGILDLVHNKAMFDWHGELIASLMKHTLIKGFRSLTRNKISGEKGSTQKLTYT
ncbi:MAG TPA: NAD(P)/FAD-dependent oxidoreductase [Syntrophorhabdales bacterium]|nr:NAD(P)/FAD-dependent oxidoreductase [Syntrophorhabdales bacterium]